MDVKLSNEQVAQFDRQIRHWGKEHQYRLLNSKILITKINRISEEIAKCVGCSGVMVLLDDDSFVQECDLPPVVAFCQRNCSLRKDVWLKNGLQKVISKQKVDLNSIKQLPDIVIAPYGVQLDKDYSFLITYRVVNNSVVIETTQSCILSIDSSLPKKARRDDNDESNLDKLECNEEYYYICAIIGGILSDLALSIARTGKFSHRRIVIELLTLSASMHDPISDESDDTSKPQQSDQVHVEDLSEDDTLIQIDSDISDHDDVR